MNYSSLISCILKSLSLVLVIFMPPAKGYAQTPTANQEAYWSFNGDTQDHSGNSRHASLQDGAWYTIDKDGDTDAACNFDGWDDYVSTPLNVGGYTAITVSAWVKADELMPTQKIVSQESNNGIIERDMYLGILQANGENRVYFYVRNGDNYLFGYTGHVVEIGNWYHLIGTWDAATQQINIYVNGIEEIVSLNPNGTLTSIGNNSNSDIKLGYGYGNADLYPGTDKAEQFQGVIDEVRIYSRALDAVEVAQLHNPQPATSIDNPLAHYPFNNNTDDETGNAYNAINNGATVITDRFGNSNSAYYFNGTSSYMQVANNSSFDFTANQDFSISVWIQPEANQADHAGIIGNGAVSGTNPGWSVRFYQDKIGHQLGNGTTRLSNFNFVPGRVVSRWDQVIVTVDRDGMASTYYNGELIESVDATAYNADLSNTYFTEIGRWASFYYKGGIDDITVFDFALTQSDVSTLYQREKGPDPTENLIGYWPFNGNTNNESTIAYHGTTFGDIALTTDRFNQPNSAYYFDGVDDYIRIEDRQAYQFAADQNFTFSVWVKPDATQAAYAGIFSNGMISTDPGYYLRYKNGALNFAMKDATTLGSHVGNDLTAYAGKWTQIVVSVNRQNTARVYLNGMLSSEQDISAVSGDIITSNFYMQFGRWGSSYYYKGAMDDIRAFEGALSDQEVLILYNNEKPTSEDPIGHWTFSGDATDQSGNNFNGTVIGAALARDRYNDDNSAYTFDGVDDYVDMGNPEELNEDFNNGITLSTWFKFNELPIETGKTVNIISKGGIFGYLPASPFALSFSQADNSLYFDLWDKNEIPEEYTRSGIACSKTDWEVGKWYHVIATWDGTTNTNSQKVFIDGELIAHRTPIISKLLINSETLFIGKSGNKYFNGSLDDIRIYERALSTEEVSMLYEAEKPPTIDDPTGHWTFTGNANDESGNNNHGIVHGAQLTFDRFGMDESAYFLEGAQNNTIVIPETDALDMSYNDLSFSVWLKGNKNQVADLAGIGFNGGNYSTNAGYWLRVSNTDGRPSFYLSDGNSNTTYGYGNSDVLDNEWHHVVFTFDRDGFARIYIDGIDGSFGSIDISDFEGFDLNNVHDLILGRINYFTGSIDDIRIYNRALSAEEVTMLYDAEKPPTIDDPTGHWTFTGNDDDVSGYNHTSNIVGDVSQTIDKNGLDNSAYYFDGDGDYLRLGEQGDFDFVANQNFSISTWIKPYGEQVSYAGIITNGVGSDNVPGWRLSYLNGDFYFMIGNGTTRTGVTTGNTNQPTNEWINVLVTAERDGLAKLFVNGVFQRSVDISDYNVDLASGVYSEAGTWYGHDFNGAMDDIRIFNRALSTEEVSMLYEAEKPSAVINNILYNTIGHWPLNNNTNDLSLNKNNGNAVGAVPTTDRHGNQFGAYAFDGNDQITTNLSVSGLNEITVSAWINASSIIGTHKIVSQESNGTSTERDMYLGIIRAGGENRVYFYVRSSTGHLFAYTGNALTTNRHYHLAGTWNAATNTIKIYIDGVEQSVTPNPSGTLSAIGNTTNSTIKFGCEYTGSGYFDGTIDDVRIYNQSLTSAEVLEIYNFERPQRINDYAGYWPFNNNADDESGNGRNGTPVSVTTATDRYGNENAAYEFDNYDYISIPSMDFTGGQAFTLSAWINPSSVAGTDMAIMGCDVANSLQLDTYGTMLIQQDGDFSSETGAVIFDQWNHVMYWFNGTEERWYINGKQSGVGHVTTLSEWTGWFAIGKSRVDANYNQFRGFIDDIRIYDRALSQGEIDLLYDTEHFEPIIEYTSNSALNYVQTNSYRENETLIAQGIQYYNLLGKPTQNISRNIEANNIVATEVVYDDFGRPVVTTLPAPVAQNSFRYIDNFINDNTFDHSAGVNYDSYLNVYYSNDNTEEAYVPHDRYPYSEVEYSQTIPGATRKSYMAGGALSEKFVTGFTVSASPDELYAHPLNASLNLNTLKDVTQSASLRTDFEGMTKSVSVDIMGKEIVTYINKEGQVIATCMRSASPVDITATYNVPVSQDIFYVDIHLPKKANNYIINKTADWSHSYRNLVTDVLTTGDRSSSFSLPPGFYRIYCDNTHGYGSIDFYTTLGYAYHSFNSYDEAGRVLRSISPEHAEQIRIGVLNATNANSYVVRNTYNIKGWLMESYSPDEGTTIFQYRRDGKIRFSQNALQANNNKFSYTNYDEHGRLVEAGEHVEQGGFAWTNINNTLLEEHCAPAEGVGGYPANSLDRTLTWYDFADINAPRTQHFTRGRAVKTQNNNTTTWYSYNYDGTIAWVIQEIEGFDLDNDGVLNVIDSDGAEDADDLITLDYTYDFLGNVTKVVYQKNKPDEFTHHYKYDLNNRLKEVYTQEQTFEKELQARYYYYQHGPLKRVELGRKPARHRLCVYH
jgi:hypothetical protein